MLTRYFYVIVLLEENSIVFLKKRRLIEIDNLPCVNCGSPTKLCTHKERGKDQIVIRSTKKGCQRTQFVRKGYTFFTYHDKNG